MSFIKFFRTCSLPLVLAVPFLAQAENPPGIKNFHQVDQHVYRGAQPDKAGFEYLQRIGVKTIINLREADSKSKEEEKLVKAAGMKYISVPMTGLTPPTENEISKILGILEDQNAGPVFVHCKRGADRTGAVIGAYRIDQHGWQNQRALDEAMSNGMSFFQWPRQAYIRTFQKRKVEAKSAVATPVVPAAVLAPVAQ